MTRRSGQERTTPPPLLWLKQRWGATTAAKAIRTGTGSWGGKKSLFLLTLGHFPWIYPGFTPTCLLPNGSWSLSCCAGILSRMRRVYFMRIWSPSVMWLYPGPCASCRTWPGTPAPFSRSWSWSSRPPTRGSGGCRARSAGCSRPAPSWTPNRRQCVSTPLSVIIMNHYYCVSHGDGQGLRVSRAALKENCTRKTHEEEEEKPASFSTFHPQVRAGLKLSSENEIKIKSGKFTSTSYSMKTSHLLL